MALYLMLIIIFVSTFSGRLSGQDHYGEVKDGEYKDTFPCPKCQKGFKPKVLCGPLSVGFYLKPSDLYCQPCPSGYYQDEENSTSSCRPCTTLDDENKVITQNCSATTRMLSKCKPGWYPNAASSKCSEKCCPDDYKLPWNMRRFRYCHKDFKTCPCNAKKEEIKIYCVLLHLDFMKIWGINNRNNISTSNCTNTVNHTEVVQPQKPQASSVPAPENTPVNKKNENTETKTGVRKNKKQNGKEEGNENKEEVNENTKRSNEKNEKQTDNTLLVILVVISMLVLLGFFYYCWKNNIWSNIWSRGSEIEMKHLNEVSSSSQGNADRESCTCADDERFGIEATEADTLITEEDRQITTDNDQNTPENSVVIDIERDASDQETLLSSETETNAKTPEPKPQPRSDEHPTFGNQLVDFRTDSHDVNEHFGDQVPESHISESQDTNTNLNQESLLSSETETNVDNWLDESEEVSILSDSSVSSSTDTSRSSTPGSTTSFDTSVEGPVNIHGNVMHGCSIHVTVVNRINHYNGGSELEHYLPIPGILKYCELSKSHEENKEAVIWELTEGAERKYPQYKNKEPFDDQMFTQRCVEMSFNNPWMTKKIQAFVKVMSGVDVHLTLEQAKKGMPHYFTTSLGRCTLSSLLMYSDWEELGEVKKYIFRYFKDQHILND